MMKRRCENCGAPVQDSPDGAAPGKVCGFCGALLGTRAHATVPRPHPGSRRTLGIVLGTVTALFLLGLLAAFLLLAERDEPASAPPQVAVIAAAPPPPPPPPAAPPEPPPPTPPREPTAHDLIRAHFERVDARLCVAGNLTRFGPFAGTVHLTAHPEGRVTHLRVAMQPEAPAVTRCLRRAFSSGPVHREGPLGVIFHFSGGRSADGLQYRSGIELKDNAR